MRDMWIERLGKFFHVLCMNELMTEYDTENCQVIIKTFFLFFRIEDYNLKEVFTTLWRCEVWEIMQEQFGFKSVAGVYV